MGANHSVTQELGAQALEDQGQVEDRGQEVAVVSNLLPLEHPPQLKVTASLAPRVEMVTTSLTNTVTIIHPPPNTPRPSSHF